MYHWYSYKKNSKLGFTGQVDSLNKVAGTGCLHTIKKMVSGAGGWGPLWLVVGGSANRISTPV